ncbi:MAG: mandelate racemase/muconate lactonizing enzyme family protein [Minwuia sp.]|nr:mandelate racemase/muconate lactonizing enzyme family protein [Minwuia sp.]
MKITGTRSHVLRYEMDEELGYSQQYYPARTAHLVEVSIDEGPTGWGECFGTGPIALANKTIVEQVLQPMVLGRDPLAREAIWQHCYNMMCDHGQKGMPLYCLLAGPTRTRIPDLADAFHDEAAAIREAGFAATKMKVGPGSVADIELATAVRDGVGDGFRFAVDANHCYTTPDALTVGRALDDLGAYWFEEPVAPEDRAGYTELRAKLKTTIAGGEAEFTRYGRRDLLAAMPDMPGGLHPWEPILEFDTTPNRFRDDMLSDPLDIQGQVKRSGGFVDLPGGPGLGVRPDPAFLDHYRIA